MEIKVSYVQARRFIDFHTLILNSYPKIKYFDVKKKKVVDKYLYFWYTVQATFGEVSEWFKEPVLKTGDSERGRGFESHLLRFEQQLDELNTFYEFSWRSTQVAEGAPLERE